MLVSMDPGTGCCHEWERRRGEVAYSAFRAACAEESLPEFEALSERMRGVWIGVAAAVCLRFGALGVPLGRSRLGGGVGGSAVGVP